MKRKCLLLVFLVFLLSSFAVFAQDVDQAPEKTQEDIVKEMAQDAEAEAEVAKKEAEIHKKAVELEKKKAEVKIKEAEAAKKEADIVKGIEGLSDKTQKAVEEAKLKEKEAQAALSKVQIAEEKMLAAQEKAQLAEEELELAKERAQIAEDKISKQQGVIYKKLLQTGLIIFIGYLLIFIFVGIVNRRVADLKARHIVRKNVIYVLNILIIIFVVFIWIQNISSITIFLSAIGAGLVVVLQEPILCMAGWLLILVRKPFEVGDRIEFNGVKGDVIDIRLFQTSLLEIGNWVEADQSTGRIVNIPNSAIFRKEDFNFSRGFEFIWNEIKIVVTFESDWKKGEEIMLKHAQKIAEGMEDIVKRKIQRMERQYMIYYDKLTPIVYTNIKDSGVELSLRYLTDTRKRRSTQDELSRKILEDFAKEETVNFAYTTYRIVKN